MDADIGLIVGVVVGIVLSVILLALIPVMVCCCRKYRYVCD